MKSFHALGAIAAALAFAAPASAAPITSVFGESITCTVKTGVPATEGQRWCSGPAAPGYTATPRTYPQSTFPSVVPSFDGAPIDVSVALPPAPASGPDGNFPVVGIFHGYGSPKIALDDANTAQRWLAQGYAVYSVTDRGFFGSCGPLVVAAPPNSGAACANGYIHLMSNAYEVRDAQYLLGLLADEHVIDPNKIGVNGGSYGGGLAMLLSTLNNRIQLPNGDLEPWKSPAGTPLHIAAGAPEYAWSDLVQALMPNGSTLDYAASNPYAGPNGDRRFGSQKLSWNAQLYGGGAAAGFYAPASGGPFPDVKANITAWKDFNNTGGPYDGDPLTLQQTNELPDHGAYNTDSTVAPAPMLIANGWNDDLFPVDEGVRIYNRIRTEHPTAPISLFELNYGHPGRGGNPPIYNVAALWENQAAWFNKYVKGANTTIANAVGGVLVAESACAAGAPALGALHQAKNWASLSAGEVRVAGQAEQTIAPTMAPVTTYDGSSFTVCTDGPSTPTAGAASYSTAPAPASGYTIAGSSTVIADLGVQGANDQLISRLYDVDPAANTEKLIGRGVYRPTGVGSTTRQVFQLHPQAWKVAAGHVVKLELLSSDQPYVRNATGQQAITVSNLDLRIPTFEKPGAAGGVVLERAAKVLPAGYTFTPDVIAADAKAAEPVIPVVPAVPVVPVNPPAPKAADPLTVGAVRTALGKAPKAIKFGKGYKTITFTDAIPEAGKVTYRVSLDVKKKGKKTRRYELGTVTKTVTAAGSVKISVSISKKNRALVKAHRRSKLVLTTSFVTGVVGDRVDVIRSIKGK